MTTISAYIPLLVRCIIGFCFIFAGICNLYYFDKKVKVIEGRRLPYPKIIFWIGFIMQCLGAICLIFNIYLFYGALLLIVFTLLASLIFHDFWNAEGDSYRLKMQGLVSNLNITAGLILVAYTMG